MKDIKKGIEKKIFSGKRGLILKILLFPLILSYRLLRFFGRIAGGSVKESKDVMETQKAEKKYTYIDIIYFTDYGLRFIKGKVEATFKFITPETIESTYGFEKVYINLNNGKPYIVLYEHHPKSIDFSKELEMYKGEIPVISLEKASKGKNKLQYTVDMKKFKIMGGKLLSDVAYAFVNTTYMNLLRPISDTKLRNTFIMALFIGIFIGGLIFSIITGLLV